MGTLRVENLVKTFGKKRAVNHVQFYMEENEVVGLLGPNGAGKTTIFYMIVGFITPSAGKIYLNDKDISRFPMFKRAKAGISYLPQEPSVFRKMTVENNIWSILETRKDISIKEKRFICDELLDWFGIERLKKQKAYTLSGGERRRTEIARALAIEPHFLLLDEPFAGIDPIAVSEIKNIIKRLSEQKKIGVLITDHNAKVTLSITNRSYIIRQGEILVEGDETKLLENPLARQFYFGEDF